MYKNKYVINFILYCSLVLLGLYMSVFQRSLTDISQYYRVVKIFTGLLITAHFTGIFIAPLIAGEMADKYGRKIVVCTSFSMLFLGLMISIFAENIYLYIIGVFLIGGGFGVIEGMITTLLVDMNNERESNVINISQAFFALGALIGPLLTGYFISIGYSWQNLYSGFAVISGFYILYFWKLPLPEVKVIEEKIKGTIVIKLLKSPLMILLALSIFMYVGVEQGIAFWITSYIETLGDSIFYPSLALSLFWGTMIVGRLLLGLYNNYDHIKMIIILTVFASISLIFVIVSGSYLTAIISFAFLGLGVSAIWPLIVALSSKFFSRYRATAIGILMAASAFGGMVIPFLGGIIRDIINIKWGMAFFVLPFIIILSCQFMLKYKSSSLTK